MITQSFTRNVVTMLSGSGLAIAVPFLCSPILARLYSPQMFGELAVFISWISIGAIVATGRFELAVHIPRTQRAAARVVVVAVMLSGLFASVVGIALGIVVIFAQLGMVRFDVPISWAMTIPFGIVGLATIQTLVYWHTRGHRYAAISKARAGQATATSGIQILMGLLNCHALFLIVAHLLGMAFALRQLLGHKIEEIRLVIKRKPGIWLRSVAYKYRHLSFYMVPGHLANIASTQAPILLFAALYSPYQAGLYAFAERLVLIPCGVISNSIGEVFRQSAAEQYRAQGNCFSLFLNTKLKLLALASLMSIATYILPPLVFPPLFGESWQESGQVASVLAVVVFFQTISSPLSQTVLLATMYRLDFAWQILRLILTIGAVYYSYASSYGFISSVRYYAVALAITYSLHSAMQYFAARGNFKSVKKSGTR